MRFRFTSTARTLVLFSVVLAARETLSAHLYSVKDLGGFADLPGRADSRPNAINLAGKIAAGNVTSGAYRAWLHGGAWTNLGTLGGDESLASGINDSHRVVGYSRNAGGTQRGFLWTPGGTDGVPTNPQMRELGTFGGAESAAFDINNSGQIAGYAQTSGRDHAFRYRDGIMTDIGASLPNAMGNSYAYSLNEAGRVAGTGYSHNWSSWRAFYYDGTNAIDLGTFAGQNSSAHAINNSDVIVGYYTLNSGFDHAFRYAGGSMTDLGTLGGNYSYANGINNRDVVVGGSFTDAGNTVFHAFIWATNTLIDLNTLLDASGAGWTLAAACAINDAGQIVGTGTRGGATRAFLLTPVVAPQITQQPMSLTVPCGSNALFTVTATPEAVFYRWYQGDPPSGAPVVNATNAILLLANATVSQAGNYYAIVTNSAGSVTSSIARLTVVDTNPPVLSGCPANRTAEIAFGLCTAVISWTNPTATDGCDGVVAVTCTPPNGSSFPSGVTTVVCGASDSSRNTNTCSFTVTVQDNEPPVLGACPGSFTNYTALGSNTTIVTWTVPAASDNCDGVLPVTCTPTNGSTFSAGVTTVVCGAADASLNTNSCSFTVTVVPTLAPQITDVSRDQSNILIRFTTIASPIYALEVSPTLELGTWNTLVTNIVGTGGVITVTNLDAWALSNRFYRVKLVTP